MWDDAMDALDGKDPWGQQSASQQRGGQDLWGQPQSVSPYQQRQNHIREQAEADRHAIISANVSKREADFEKSGLPPARFQEWVKDWNAKNGMDY
jgi:hypothetical protein